MKTKEEARDSVQHLANERQEPVTLYTFESKARAPFVTPAFDCVESRRFERERARPFNYTAVEVLEPQYRRLEDIKRRNAKLGNHWFEPSTLRFFSSRVHSAIYTRGRVAYFVSSEKPPHGRRAYSVRRANADGSIDTVGEFCGYRTGRQAHARAAWIAEHGEEA